MGRLRSKVARKDYVSQVQTFIGWLEIYFFSWHLYQFCNNLGKCFVVHTPPSFFGDFKLVILQLFVFVSELWLLFTAHISCSMRS